MAVPLATSPPLSSPSSSFLSAELLRRQEGMHRIPSEPLPPSEEAAAAGDHAVVHGDGRSLAGAATGNASREELERAGGLKPREGGEVGRRTPRPPGRQGHGGRLNAAAADDDDSSKPEGPGAPAEGSGGDGGAIHHPGAASS